MKKDSFPGDFIPEVRVVWASGSEGKDLFLVMANSVKYKEEFNTMADLAAFKDFVKKHKGSTTYRLYSEFGGKTTHLATTISLQHFDSTLRKRIIKTVSLIFKLSQSRPANLQLSWAKIALLSQLWGITQHHTPYTHDGSFEVLQSFSKLPANRKQTLTSAPLPPTHASRF